MARGEITGRGPQVTPGRARRRRGPPIRAKDSTPADDGADDAAQAGAISREREPTPHAEAHSNARPKAPRVRGPPPAAYSIPQFCAAHNISESFYFKLQRQGLGPAEMRLGTRVLITQEAAEHWRREREAATAAAS
jgi:hypothetical protein